MYYEQMRTKAQYTDKVQTFVFPDSKVVADSVMVSVTSKPSHRMQMKWYRLILVVEAMSHSFFVIEDISRMRKDSIHILYQQNIEKHQA